MAYYFRNEDLNANNFFSNEAGQPRQKYRYNIGSYYIGGPVVLPKIYRGNSNLFFFFNQEFQSQIVSYRGRGKDRADRAGATRAIFRNPTTPTAARSPSRIP